MLHPPPPESGHESSPESNTNQGTLPGTLVDSTHALIVPVHYGTHCCLIGIGLLKGP